MKKTIEEKREFAHRRLLAMASAQRAAAALMIAKARKASTLAAFYEMRAMAAIDGLDELTLDMMIEDWSAALDVERWHQELADAERETFGMLEFFVGVVRQVRVTAPSDGDVVWRAEVSDVPEKKDGSRNHGSQK